MEKVKAGRREEVAGAVRTHGPLVAQVYLHVAQGALFLLTKVLLVGGMSHYVFVTYRQAVATLAIAPFAFFLERITLSQNFTFAGLALTNTTLSGTMSNLVPAMTFLMAVCLRLEKVDIWGWRGQAKIVGTLLCVGGAMVVTFSTGPAASVNSLNLHKHPLNVIFSTLNLAGAFESSTGSWILGSVLLFIEDAPSELTGAAWICGLGALQSLVVALFIEPSSAWRLKWDLQLVNILYSDPPLTTRYCAFLQGILCTALALFIQMWCMKERGPIFSTTFSPLTTVLIAIFEPFLLHVQFHWASLVGIVMVIAGLYSVLWGKAVDGNFLQGKSDPVEVTFGSEAYGGIKQPLLPEGQRRSDGNGAGEEEISNHSDARMFDLPKHLGWHCSNGQRLLLGPYA
ncbi:hypothetical protein Taro_001950 [Colocasia esculenta]|uniref:WAT1-related protein n=1 Tax=Colocasia esculenta TaxID=4460 RepID=A0A843TFW1_COLES|nr:hypothetical protein [Colocasia esculenta]